MILSKLLARRISIDNPVYWVFTRFDPTNCTLISAGLSINTILYKVQSSGRVTLKEKGDNLAH